MNWEAVAVILTAVSFLLALATAYLRLFVANELNKLREAIDGKFISQQVFNLHKERLETELATIRRDLERA